MEIQVSTQGAPVDSQLTVPDTKKRDRHVTEASYATEQPSTEVSLSAPSRLIQELDNTSDAMDKILFNHLDKTQKAQLQEIYTELDRAFDQGGHSPENDKKIDALFERAHQIFGTSLDKLSMDEHKQLDQLNNKLIDLESNLAMAEQGELTLPTATFSPIQQQAPGSNPTAEVAANTGISAPAKKNKTEKALSVAELNALSAVELNKLPAHQLKKLNTNQLNKLNASQLSLLPSSALQKLSPTTLAKLPKHLVPE